MKNVFFFAMFAVLTFFVNSCDTVSTDPNQLGGNTDVGFTDVGDRTGAWLQFGDEYIYQKDSIVVIKNENGIVTTFAMFELDTADFRRIDTMLGMQFLSSSEKYNIMKIYFSKFGATIDTSDKKTVKITSEFRIRVTSEGIQDFFNSGNNLSRPFTLVKYSSNVGDKYEFTDMDNKKITREVVYKSTDNDYEIGFFRIKVMKIDEIEDDPMYKKITYVANHKYGLVGIIITLNNNKTVTLSLSPANM